MPKSRIAIALNPAILAQLDKLVTEAGFPSRSQAVEAAIEEKLERLGHTRLARECAKIDPEFEKAMAEEGLNEDLSTWPKY